MTGDPAVLLRLAETIRARRGADPKSSHTAKLLARGPGKAAEKFGEEAVEAIVEAARAGTSAFRGEALAAETADVLYHLLVMLEACDVPFEQALAALTEREGVSGVAEKAARSEPIVIEEALSAEAVLRCQALRVDVFVAEQGVAAELEQDGEDGACRHWIAHRGIDTLGTARVKAVGPDGGQGAKIQRVAVSRRARSSGLGARLMTQILGTLKAEGLPIWLQSQTSVIAFYERLGFVAEGPEFLDAGLPHRSMVLRQD